jgi:hypothetical protein
MRLGRRCCPPASATVLLLAVALCGASASPVRAATFGSDLSGAVEASGGCIIVTAPCTSLVGSVPAANAYPASSPIDGVVVAFGIKVGAPTASITFRLAQSSGTEFAGAGTGPTVSIPAAGTYSIPARVRARSNDYVAVDGSETAAFESTCFLGATALLFSPPLAEGAAEPFGASGICGLAVDATVEPDADSDGFGDETQDRCPGIAGPVEGCPGGGSSPSPSPSPTPSPIPTPTPTPTPPSNVFRLISLKQNPKQGTASVVAVVPGPGTLRLSGARIRAATVVATGAGSVPLRISPRRTVRRTLAAKGSLPVRFEVSFQPAGALASTIARRAVLRRVPRP